MCTVSVSDTAHVWLMTFFSTFPPSFFLSLPLSVFGFCFFIPSSVEMAWFTSLGHCCPWVPSDMYVMCVWHRGWSWNMELPFDRRSTDISICFFFSFVQFFFFLVRLLQLVIYNRINFILSSHSHLPHRIGEKVYADRVSWLVIGRW